MANSSTGEHRPQVPGQLQDKASHHRRLIEQERQVPERLLTWDPRDRPLLVMNHKTSCDAATTLDAEEAPGLVDAFDANSLPFLAQPPQWPIFTVEKIPVRRS